jgi:diguanylate cyclase (GGDEF)-like protein/PAS domain S-box-containing protein
MAQAARAGTELDERLVAIVSRCWDGISVHGRAGTLLFCNEAFGRILGTEPCALMGRDPFDFVHPDDIALVLQDFRDTLQGNGARAPIQYRAQHEAGGWRSVESVAVNLLDEPLVGAVVITTRDVTERLSAEARLQRLALQDSVTGLANRAGLHTLLAQLGAPRHGTLAMMYIEVDGFDWLIDSRGHAFGDQALRALGSRLRASIESGIVAHLGCGAFVVAIDVDASPSGAVQTAHTVARTLEQPLRVCGQVLEASTSIGLAFARDADMAAADLLQNAAASAHSAREQGGGRIECFDERMVTRIERRMILTQDLRAAVAAKDFCVVYQPIVSVADTTIVGVEALLRWGRDCNARYEPDEFIVAAEQTGLIVPLGGWVIEQAVAARAALPRDTNLILNLNLSVRQLAEPGLAEFIASSLSRFAIAAEQVAFEVTETLALHDFERATRVLNDIRALGCHVGIDDFGTGYSSLGYLRQLPVDFIKIDRMFIKSLGADPSVDALVAAIIAMAHALHLDVVAEGVETEFQLERLRIHGCGHAQGLLFSPPRPSLATLALPTT